MNKYLIVLGIFLGVLGGATILKAQDNNLEGANAEETLEYTYGSIVSASPVEVVINEYNYETDEESNVSYLINPETKFNNIDSAQSLVKDDNVDIYYKVIGDQRVARMITKDETVYDTEEGLDEGEEVGNEQLTNEATNSVPQPSSSEINATRG